MTLFLSARLVEPASPSLISDLQTCALLSDETTFLCDISDYGDLFQKAYERIRKHNNDFIKQTICYAEDVGAYPSDAANILAYVLDTRYYTDYANPATDLMVPNPKCSRTSMRVRNDVALLLSTKPKGILTYVGEELVFHNDILGIFDKNEVQELGRVMIRGKAAPEWHRLRVKKAPIIDPNSLQKGFCVRCSSQCTFSTLLWLANSDDKVELPLFNETGLGHLNARDVLIVPLSVRQLLI